MLDEVIAATAEVGAKLVMVDNLYSYGPQPMSLAETTPARATDSKGRVRRAMAETLLTAHEAGRLRVAIGRASDYFGPACGSSAITALAIEPAFAGKPIRWIGRSDVPHTTAYLPDIARAYVVLGTSDLADGRIWHLPHAPAVTGASFLALVNAALDTPVETAVLPTAMLRLAAPFHRMSREMLGIAYQWIRPFVVDDSAFQATFGPFDVTPLPEAVATTVAWYQSRRAASSESPHVQERR